MMGWGIRTALVTWLMLWTFTTHAQDEAGGAGGAAAAGGGGASAEETGANVDYELGGQYGWLLPNQIPGVTEIMSLGGLRAGYKLAPWTFAEAGLIMGNGDGAEWRDMLFSIRMDIPVENLVGFAYIGGDAIYYKGLNKSQALVFGGHAGGGIQSNIGGMVWLRGDMKFSVSPGTSLYIGVGLVFRIGGGGGGGGGPS